jgi:hypothetical protein
VQGFSRLIVGRPDEAFHRLVGGRAIWRVLYRWQKEGRTGKYVRVYFCDKLCTFSIKTCKYSFTNITEYGPILVCHVTHPTDVNTMQALLT